MSALPKPRMTAFDYLVFERASTTKHEFHAGEVFAMAGASANHNRIVRNLTARIHPLLRNTGCELFQSDLRVKVSFSGLYTYPDVVVVCGEPQFEDDQVDTLLNPKVLVEVLSPSTEAYDRGTKAEHYRRLPSLTDYVLVSQDRCHVEVHSRQPQPGWLLTEFNELSAEFRLHGLDVGVPLTAVYEGVPLPDSPRLHPPTGNP